MRPPSPTPVQEHCLVPLTARQPPPVVSRLVAEDRVVVDALDLDPGLVGELDRAARAAGRQQEHCRDRQGDDSLQHAAGIGGVARNFLGTGWEIGRGRLSARPAVCRRCGRTRRS